MVSFFTFCCLVIPAMIASLDNELHATHSISIKIPWEVHTLHLIPRSLSINQLLHQIYYFSWSASQWLSGHQFRHNDVSFQRNSVFGTWRWKYPASRDEHAFSLQFSGTNWADCEIESSSCKFTECSSWLFFPTSLHDQPTTHME